MRNRFSLPASLFKVCDLNDDGEDLHQVDQANDGDKDRHLHHERAGCHETAEGQGTRVSHEHLRRINIK